MNRYQFSNWIYRSLIILSFTICTFIAFSEKAHAQTNAVIISPYYGNHTITQGWSSSFEPNHHAYDFDLNYQNVIAADSGTVSKVQWYSNTCHNYSGLNDQIGLPCGYGLYLRITHGSSGYTTWYAHTSASAFALADPGSSTVVTGQVIATSGNTGWSTAAHLHFETRLNNVNVDPFSPNLWKDGEWATPSRPIPQPVDGQQTIQVSDGATNSSSFSKGDAQNPNGCNGNCASWTRNTNNLWYYTYSNGNATDSWAKWTPQGVPSGGGIYEVYVQVLPGNNQSWQVPYTIYNASNGVLGSGVVDQLGSTDKWLSIGTYYLTQGAYVRVTDATGETTTRQFAADDVMFVRRGTTYAPDVRSSGGWTSTVYLRSNGGTAKYLFKCLDAAGAPVGPSYVDTLAAHAVTTPVCLVSGYSSVVVDASQDVSVLVENRKAGEATNYSGIPAGTGATGWDGTGTTLYVPTLKRGMYGRSGKIYSFFSDQCTKQQQHECPLARLCGCGCRPADCHFGQSDQQWFGRCCHEL